MRITYLLKTVLTMGVVLSVTACASDKMLADKLQKNGISHLPRDAYGVVYIDSPTTGSLLYLRGTVGKGIMLLRKKQSELCAVKEVKIAAGDFEGRGVSVTQSDDVWLTIYNPDVAQELLNGKEVVSDDVVITDSNSASLGDIRIHSGVAMTQGFVLNPSEWQFVNLFSDSNEAFECAAEKHL